MGGDIVVMNQPRPNPKKRWGPRSVPLSPPLLATLLVIPCLTLCGGCGVRRDVLETVDGSALAPVSRWTSAVCTVNRTCCGPEPEALNALATCEADLDTVLGLTDALDSGRLVVDQTILNRCEIAAKTAACNAAIPDFEPCRGALKGTLPTDGVCRSSYECAGGTNGDPAICFKGTIISGDEVLPAATGVCRPSPLAKLGDPCVLTVDYDLAQPRLSGDLATAAATYPRCSKKRGLSCGAASTCVAAPGVGDPCWQYGDDCGSGLACSCGLCEANEALSNAMAPFCVDGACTSICPSPVATGDGSFCVETIDSSDGKCHVPSLYCGYSTDCPSSWAAAQSPSSCNGGGDTIILGACGDTKSWHRPTENVTCYYDDTSGKLVGVVNDTATADQFCYGASPAQLKLFAGHVPPNCPGDASGTSIDCARSGGCDGGSLP